jgi:hypothetical protein
MGSGSTLRLTMHPLGTKLYLDEKSAGGHDGQMNRPVAVRLGASDVVVVLLFNNTKLTVHPSQ